MRALDARRSSYAAHLKFLFNVLRECLRELAQPSLARSTGIKQQEEERN